MLNYLIDEIVWQYSNTVAQIRLYRMIAPKVMSERIGRAVGSMKVKPAVLPHARLMALTNAELRARLKAAGIKGHSKARTKLAMVELLITSERAFVPAPVVGKVNRRISKALPVMLM